jgi:hypothetical protein
MTATESSGNQEGDKVKVRKGKIQERKGRKKNRAAMGRANLMRAPRCSAAVACMHDKGTKKETRAAESQEQRSQVWHHLYDDPNGGRYANRLANPWDISRTMA